ncbi:MFS transporter [Pseudorhodoferax sp. Leaf267]|uniref:MFS transporter n=1 Tax=Pseudorhodoferax sp. Leaf267 TaxID=1736316 RepID=UPI00138EFB45|nr:MFS transporter [Pseudorhodoferax sp. Leaf267]
MPVSPAAAARPAWLVANLVAQLAFGLLAMTICLPSMQDWPTQFGATQAQVQLGFGGYVAAYGVAQLVYGAVSDRIGRKPVLLAGLLLAFAGSVAAALSTDIWALNLARLVQGAGCAAGMVIGRAMVQDLFTGGERTRVMAFIGMMMGLCPPAAMLIGGQVHARVGWQANFVVMALLAVGLFVAAWRGLPAMRPSAQGQTAGLRQLVAGYVQLGREPSFVLHVAILAMTAASFYTFLGGAPLVLANYGVRPERIGLYVMCPPVAYVFGNLLTQRLLRNGRSDGFLMVAGHASTLTGIVTVLLLGLAGVHTPLALALPLLLLGIGHGLLLPPTLTGTVGLVPALAGSAAAVAGLMQQLTGAVGGIVVGLVPLQGPVWLALLMLLFSGLGFVAQLALSRKP